MRDEELELEELEELLGRAKSRCAYCIQQGLSNDEHLLFSCRQVHSQRVREEHQRFKEGIRQSRTMEKVLWVYGVLFTTGMATDAVTDTVTDTVTSTDTTRGQLRLGRAQRGIPGPVRARQGHQSSLGPSRVR
jgi:hypothetical protein